MAKRVRKEVQKKVRFKTSEDFEDMLEYEAYVLVMLLKGIDFGIDEEEAVFYVKNSVAGGLGPQEAYELGLEIREVTDKAISKERH